MLFAKSGKIGVQSREQARGYHGSAGARHADPHSTAPSAAFDSWLTEAVTSDAQTRAGLLAKWEQAPAARQLHPRKEHLILLIGPVGAAGGPGQLIHSETVKADPSSALQKSQANC